MSRWVTGFIGGGVRNNAYALSGYPRPIFPTNPEFSRCVPEFGQELNKKDCKEAIRLMPTGREGAEVDYAVNFHAQQYNLPMSYVWRIAPTADGRAETTGNCVISIEVGGPQAFYDPQSTYTPFTIRASPFQIRGLAAFLVNDCVVRGGRVGGFATTKMSNLLNYLRDPQTDLSAPIPISAHFLTVSVKATSFGDPQPGNTHPSMAVYIAETFTNLMSGANNALKNQLGPLVHRMVTVSQKMRPGGNTPWWQQVPDADEKMSYECDASLGAPQAVDCALVEDQKLGLDDDTFSIQAGLSKILSSGTCQLAITAATTITLNWRQIRTAMDTLFNICVYSPLNPATGGRASFGHQTKISRRARWEKRQDDDGLSGLNALPPGVTIEITGKSARPPERELGQNSTLADNSTTLINTTYARPPERELGQNSTLADNSTTLVNATYALPAF